MYLLGQKIRARSIQEPLGDVNLPHQLEPQVLEAIVSRLRLGEASPIDKQQLYNGHIRLAINIAGKYAHQAPRKTNDLVQESLLAVGVAIEAVASGKTTLEDNNFTPWCVVRMHGACSTFINKDRIVGIPRKTFSDREHAGKPMTPIVTVSLQGTASESSIVSEEVDEYTQRRRRSFRKTRTIEVRTSIRMIDLRELIDKSTKTEEEKKIIKLREQGYKDVEIAAQLGISKSQVNILRTRVTQRFEQLETE